MHIFWKIPFFSLSCFRFLQLFEMEYNKKSEGDMYVPYDNIFAYKKTTNQKQKINKNPQNCQPRCL